MNRNELLELLNLMTVEEKVAQLLQLSGAFFNNDGVVTGPARYLGLSQFMIQNSGSGLNLVSANTLMNTQKDYLEKSNKKIPLLFMADIINGYKTIFPIPLGMACSFNPELHEECARISARESSVSGLHVTFSPMVDLVRDPRWGRVMESTGEDSFLNGIYAKAMVKGYQGNSLQEEGTIAACVKHFAAYGAPSGGRDYGWVDMSIRTLREEYLGPFKAALDEGCALIMSSFNSINGIPATGNKWLMQDILRKEWDFRGVTISDYASIQEMVNHGYAKDEEEAARLGIEAGIDIDMMSSAYGNHLVTLIKKGVVKEDMVDESVLRVLELKNNLGLFENPYRFADVEKEKEIHLSKEHREVARNAANESFVLLKNEGILPLKKEDKIAFIGPYVESTSLYGAWTMFADRNDVVTIKEGIENRKDVVNASFEIGSPLILEDPWFQDENNWNEEERQFHKERAIQLAMENDVVVLALGEHYLYSGEGSSRAEITLPQVQLELVEEIEKVNKNIIVLLFTGRPLDITSLHGKVKGILLVWFPGTEGGNSIADVLFGDYNPSGRLTMSFPYSVGQVPVYYNHYTTGRPADDTKYSNRYSSRYMDIPNRPLYPFGYGLSYSEFEYSNVSVTSTLLKADSSMKAYVTVKNTGDMAGYETVQLYIRDLYGSVVRPVKELKGFQKIFLKPKEERRVEFEITEEMLRFYNEKLEYKSEAGEFVVYIGRDSSVSKGEHFFLEI